jgi:FAD/FMN-containing dehydrogenase
MPDFVAFRSAFKGDLITPDHPDYETSLSRWAANAQRRAAIVAFVRDDADVALALRYARGAGLGVAVRGGGHNPAGASSIADGLVIDLSRHLSGTRVDAEARLAYVGGGALWAGVNAETAKYGLATTGGNVSHVRLLLLMAEPHCSPAVDRRRRVRAPPFLPTSSEPTFVG